MHPPQPLWLMTFRAAVLIMPLRRMVCFAGTVKSGERPGPLRGARGLREKSDDGEKRDVCHGLPFRANPEHTRSVKLEWAGRPCLWSPEL